ncbi:50S ribosome-binding GTPase [Candidatus Woesearchaeota archaeon]|nr:50S ribosome-binding GTPase [Candidatus Woesearchaeota archaeon]
MKNFWEIVNKVIKDSDIILLVMDARFPELTDNPELQERAGEKPIIHVLNKTDLVERSLMEKWKKKKQNVVYLSAKEHKGTTILLRKILELAQGKNVTVGVVGYPNTGKSSVINALKGRHATRTSPHSGFTKGRQLVRITENIYLLDTPGVLPYMEKDEIKLSVIGARDFTKTKDPDLAAMELINQKRNIICKHYGIKEGNAEKIIKEIALKYKKLGKGGIANIDATARMILKDWQKGKIS